MCRNSTRLDPCVGSGTVWELRETHPLAEYLSNRIDSCCSTRYAGDQDLDAYRDDDWNHQDVELNQEQLRLQTSDSETLGKVVTASAAIQQLLLELAVLPSAGRPRQTIIDAVAWVLDNTPDIAMAR